MIADINGISMGQRDALIENGVEFLYTNIHTHHGMYPLYQNQKPYFWENENGQRLLVWNGEHYNLGNALGIVLNKNVNFMTENYFGKKNGDVTGLLENLHTNLAAKHKGILKKTVIRTISISPVFPAFFRIMRRSTRPLQIRLRCLMKNMAKKSPCILVIASGIV